MFTKFSLHPGVFHLYFTTGANAGKNQNNEKMVISLRIPCEVLQTTLDFMYGQLPLTDKDWCNLEIGADLLDISDVQDISRCRGTTQTGPEMLPQGRQSAGRSLTPEKQALPVNDIHVHVPDESAAISAFSNDNNDYTEVAQEKSLSIGPNIQAQVLACNHNLVSGGLTKIEQRRESKRALDEVASNAPLEDELQEVSGPCKRMGR